MSETAVSTLPADPESVEDEDDDEPGVRYYTSSRPGMVAVRRRSKRRRRRRHTADVRARQIRIGLLVLILGMIGYSISGRSVHALAYRITAQIFRPIYTVVIGLHLEVVALGIAAVVLIYLTPGVEESVLKFFGIRRSSRSGRR